MGGFSEPNKLFVQFAKTLNLSADNNYHCDLFQTKYFVYIKKSLRWFIKILIFNLSLKIKIENFSKDRKNFTQNILFAINMI